MSQHVVASADVIADGERIVVDIEGVEVGIFRRGEEFHAFRNWCPHQGGPVCEGPLTGTLESSFDRKSLTLETRHTRESEVLNCPWHGWEFDIATGECLSKEKVMLVSYEVTVEDGDIVVTL